MLPPGTEIRESTYTTFWLLTGVAGGIDLNRMSTASRRDFPAGVSGSQMGLQPETCFVEVPFSQPPPFSYLLGFTGTLKEADLRRAGDAAFSGRLYDSDHGYSQQIFQQCAPDYADHGCDCMHRFSFAIMRDTGRKEDVLSLFPSAREKLALVSVAPVGPGSPPVPITLFGGSTKSSADYPLKPNP